MNATGTFLAVAAIAALAACAPAEEAASDPAAEPQSAGEAGVVETTPKNLTLAETAWRASGEDGAVFTTYLDADGTYRDHKNGEPLQDGEWEEVSQGRICFTPAKDETSGECWALEKPDAEGVMRATNDAEKVIELRRVTYVAPQE